MIRKILFILSPKERREGAFLALGNAFISILDIASLGALLYLVAFYTGQRPDTRLSFLPPWLRDSNSLAPITLFSLFFLAKSAGAYWMLRSQYHFVYRVASRISETNMLRYLEGAYADYVQVDASVQIRRISQQPIEFCQYVLAGVQQVLTEGVLVALSVMAILWYNSRLFLLLLCLLLPAVAILAFFSRRRLRSVRKGIRSSGEKSLQYLREALSGFVEGNLYDSIPFFAQRYGRRQADLNEHLSVLQILQGIPSRLIEVVAVAGLFILIAFGKWSGNAQATTYITLGAYLAAAYKIIPGLVKIFNIGGQIKTYRFTVEDLLVEARKTPRPAVPAPSDHQRPSSSDRRRPSDLGACPTSAGPTVIGSVIFKKVGFSQPQGRVLHGLDICLQSGEMVGLSGASGRGKTTIVNLLLGFFRPQEGTILVNGQLAEPGLLRSYWGRIAYVQQHPFLLHDTILQNIILSEERYDEERLRKAVDAAGLRQFGSSSGEGLNKMIMENGKNISGGQRQRIAFARALYKEADLLILDEPFSELDESAEKEMLYHCRQLAREGRMVILITHNRENLSLCNKIILLDDESTQ